MTGLYFGGKMLVGLIKLLVYVVVGGLTIAFWLLYLMLKAIIFICRSLAEARARRRIRARSRVA